MTEQQKRYPRATTHYCAEKERLLREFVSASHELIELQSQQTQAVIDGDPEFARFDDLLYMARTNKDRAKYILLAHLEEHSC